MKVRTFISITELKAILLLRWKFNLKHPLIYISVIKLFVRNNVKRWFFNETEIQKPSRFMFKKITGETAYVRDRHFTLQQKAPCKFDPVAPPVNDIAVFLSLEILFINEHKILKSRNTL